MTEIAWAAGLFEGEGAISRERNGAGSIRLTLNTTDGDVIARFHDAVGVGTIAGPHEPRDNRVKPYWIWRCSTLDAVSTLKSLLPYLGERRSARAEELLEERRVFVAECTRPRDCVHCGENFSPPYSQTAERRIYCSDRCKDAANAARRYAVA